jgi:hypothetical protein
MDEENQERVLSGGGRHGKKRARKMADQPIFRYKNVQPEKPPIYRGGAAAEQGFCTPHESLQQRRPLRWPTQSRRIGAVQVG